MNKDKNWSCEEIQEVSNLVWGIICSH